MMAGVPTASSVPAGSSGDEQTLDRLARQLADGIDAALPTWVVGHVERLAVAWHGHAGVELTESARQAGERARAEVGPAVRALLTTDVDEQHTNPLSVLRAAVVYPTAVLEAAGVPPVERDPFTERAFPQDVYDLSPAGFADLDPDLLEPGLAWGAAKAYVVLNRRKAEGRR